MPGDAGTTVVTCSCAFLFRTRGCGRIARPAFPAPSEFQMRFALAKLARPARRDRGGVGVNTAVPHPSPLWGGIRKSGSPSSRPHKGGGMKGQLASFVRTTPKPSGLATMELRPYDPQLSDSSHKTLSELTHNTHNSDQPPTQQPPIPTSHRKRPWTPPPSYPA
jgi:hypothetical protein